MPHYIQLDFNKQSALRDSICIPCLWIIEKKQVILFNIDDKKVVGMTSLPVSYWQCLHKAKQDALFWVTKSNYEVDYGFYEKTKDTFPKVILRLILFMFTDI